MLVASYVLSLHIINKGSVHDLITAGGGIVARKIPVAGIGGAGFVERFDGLINDLNRGVNIGRSYQLGDFIGDFLCGKWFINLTHNIFGM